MRRLLIVEDELILRETYELILSSQPYDIFTAGNGQEALELCEQHTFDLILLDLMMPVVNGVEFLKRFDLTEHTETKVIILSNLSSGDMLDEALDLGAYRNAVKAELSPRQLLSLVQYEVEAV